ncbi:FadR family transcriptional regulator [Sporolactobacillus sp. THM7-4]|nr:FadR family transcriptional regulator [Sporolactobacillus sp. THM7-4]
MDKDVSLLDKKEFSIEPVPRIFEQVSQQIINYIRDNDLKPGDRLPSERTLSELLQVSRSSIREALKILELSSFLRSRQGEGTFVQQPDPFLIPSQISGIPANDTDLQKYFSIFLICSKDLTLSSMIGHSDESDKSHEPESDGNSFWEAFCCWIKSIKVNESDVNFELWNCTYQFLLNHHYFDFSPPDITIEKFLQLYHENNVIQMIRLFEELDT